MILKNLIKWFIISCFMSNACAFWEVPSSINSFVTRWTKDTTPKCEAKKNTYNSSESGPKECCDENQLMLQLARLYIISPERIILLLTMDTLKETCQDISCIIQRINTSFSYCIPLPADNLYIKLFDGLQYFNSLICHHNSTIKTKIKHITEYQDCLRELREELIECEGPPDWFEKANKTVVCQYFNEIINCNYVKAAMLCGLTPARLLRKFSADVMKQVLLFKCQVGKRLPHVDDPMPARGCKLKMELKHILYLFTPYFLLRQ